MKKTDHVSQLALELYHIDALSPRERKRVEAALASDPELRSRYDALAKSDEALDRRYPADTLPAVAAARDALAPGAGTQRPSRNGRREQSEARRGRAQQRRSRPLPPRQRLPRARLLAWAVPAAAAIAIIALSLSVSHLRKSPGAVATGVAVADGGAQERSSRQMGLFIGFDSGNYNDSNNNANNAASIYRAFHDMGIAEDYYLLDAPAAEAAAYMREQIERAGSDINIIVLDYHYSNAITQEALASIFGGFDKDYAVFAPASGLPAPENDSDGSVFAQSLAAGLRGAACMDDGRVTLSALYDYVTVEMERNDQTLYFSCSRETLLSDMVLSDINEAPASISFDEELSGKIIIRDSSGVILLEMNKDNRPLRLGFTAGYYELYLQAGDGYYEVKTIALEENNRTVPLGIGDFAYMLEAERGGPSSSAPASHSGVYMAGYSDGKPCYWEYGVKKELELSGLSNSRPRITASAAEGGSVYIAGYYFFGNANDDTRACYWANGKQIDLPGGTRSRAFGITVKDGTVYTAGVYGDRYQWKACYWVNGEAPIDLPGGTSNLYSTNAYADSVAIIDGKVYATGFYEDGTLKKPCFWAEGGNRNDVFIGNGTIHDFTISGGASDDSGIVYAAGDYENKAAFWADGIRTELHESGWKSSSAKAITVQGGRVYVLGEYDDGTINYCYWVYGDGDGAGSRRELHGGIPVFSKWGMSVAGGKVQIAGNGPESAALYWVDGEIIALSGGYSHFIAVE